MHFNNTSENYAGGSEYLKDAYPPVPSGYPSCFSSLIDRQRDYFTYMWFPSPNGLTAAQWEQWKRGCFHECTRLGEGGNLQDITTYLTYPQGTIKTTDQPCALHNSCATKKDACLARCETTQNRYRVAGDPNTLKQLCNPATLCSAETKYSDDHTMFDLISRTFGRSLERGAANPAVKCTRRCDDPSHTRAELGQNPPVFGTCHNYEELCVEGDVFFDASCRPVSDSAAAHCKLDYSIKYQPSSPISLLWEPDVRIGEAATVVKFKLDISQPDPWYVWYGSAATPLLVYDPSDTRQVMSVTQLFGNWTFGGNRRASAVAGTMTDGAAADGAAPWRDGYEALATLDANGDGRVAGDELSVLALWFDRNRDAVSQPGEIVELSDTGVTSLSVGPGVADPVTRHVTVQNGFSRVVAGREQSGGTVDWYGDGAETMQELVIEQRAKGRAPAESLDQLLAQASGAAASGRKAKQDEVQLDQTGVPDSKLTGVWMWRGADDPADARDRGALMLREHQGNWLEVVSLAETPIRDARKKVAGAQSLNVFGGPIVAEANGETKVSFSSLGAPSAASGKGGPDVVSEATLTAPDTLTGSTTERIVSANGQESTITYRWTAHRRRQ